MLSWLGKDPLAGPQVRIGRALTMWGPVVAWMVALSCFSSLSQRPGTPGMAHVAWDDKLQHATAYAILAALVWRALGSRMNAWKRALSAAGIASLYGASDEFHQWFVPGRSASVDDWVYDTLGAVVICLLLIIFDRRQRFWQTKDRTRVTR